MSNDLMTTKIAGAGLATALGLFALAQVSGFVVPGFGAHGAGHGENEHAETSLNEQYAANYAYYVPVAEGGGGSGPAVEEVFDLGAALASADLSKGERAFKGNCKTCHTIEEGGANGTGPNLFGIVGHTKAGHAGFGYSSALQSAGGTWTYEDLNAWLEKPGSFVKGTSMSFVGLRKDKQRAEVIAYLASMSPNAPAFPDPLPAAAPEGAHDGEGIVEDAALEGADANADTAEAAMTETESEAGDAATETVTEAVTGAAENVAGKIEAGVESATGGMELPDQEAFDHAADMDGDKIPDADTDEH